MKRLYMICGLICSGKTTYAKSNFNLYTDLDEMHDYATKQQQIDWTKKLLTQSGVVAHITTYPTQDEINLSKEYNTTFVLIDTSLEQCKSNILIRNRERDMLNLANVLKANTNYSKQFNSGDIKFSKVKVF